ncbi:MAG TPA: hypothetical protein VF857_06625 [Spirochaetota bacterium]
MVKTIPRITHLIILKVSLIDFSSFLFADTTVGNPSADKTEEISLETPDEYQINGTSVSLDDFKKFLSTLKEIDQTWFCAETNHGGITGYDARDDKGKVYHCRFESISGKSRQSIQLQENHSPAPDLPR